MLDFMIASGAAGAALAEIVKREVACGATWFGGTVKTTGAALTDFSFDVCFSQADYDAGTWIAQITGTQWADAAKFHDGEESGMDASNTRYVNTLGDGESCVLRLLLRNFYAFRFRALGSGATVTIEGSIL